MIEVPHKRGKLTSLLRDLPLPRGMNETSDGMPLKKQTKLIPALFLFLHRSEVIGMPLCHRKRGLREGIFEKGSLYLPTLLHFLIMHCLFINEEEKGFE